MCFVCGGTVCMNGCMSEQVYLEFKLCPLITCCVCAVCMAWPGFGWKRLFDVIKATNYKWQQ